MGVDYTRVYRIFCICVCACVCVCLFILALLTLSWHVRIKGWGVDNLDDPPSISQGNLNLVPEDKR